MKRFAEKHLENWFLNQHRKPLVIRGARQVGKSTLVRQFAKNNQLILNEINLEQHLELNDVFGALNVNRILRELEGLVKRHILAPNALLFLDEIQATPRA